MDVEIEKEATEEERREEKRKAQRKVWDEWWKGARLKESRANPHQTPNSKQPNLLRKKKTDIMKRKKKESVEKNKVKKKVDSEKKRKEDGIQLSVKEMVARFETAGCESNPESAIGKKRSLRWRSTKNFEVASTETDDKVIHDSNGVEVEKRKGSGRTFAPQ